MSRMAIPYDAAPPPAPAPAHRHVLAPGAPPAQAAVVPLQEALAGDIAAQEHAQARPARSLLGLTRVQGSALCSHYSDGSGGDDGDDPPTCETGAARFVKRVAVRRCSPSSARSRRCSPRPRPPPRRVK
jgi:hypothetical protein